METTKSVGQDRAGFDDTLFRKCEAEIAQLQSNLTSASLGALVSKIGRDDIKAFREAMGMKTFSIKSVMFGRLPIALFRS